MVAKSTLDDAGDATISLPDSDDTGVDLRPILTAVVCTYNRYDVLSDALGSLESQSLPAHSLEILVVDNSSELENQAAYWARHELPSNGRLIAEKMAGLSHARNLALRKAAGSIIAFIDDDVIAAPDWCATIVDCFESVPDAGIVGGPVEPIWPGNLPAWLGPPLREIFALDYGKERRALLDQEAPIGTNIAFRTDVLEEVGGFQETLGRVGMSLLSNGEVHIAKRMKTLGYDCYYEPQAKVFHRVHGSRANAEWLRRRVCWQVVSDLLMESPKMRGDMCWKRLAEYLDTLPPEMRGVRGLFLDTSDPEVFHGQCEALQAAMYLALNEGRDPEAT
jgi:GT2 family glycosyltransferase